MESRPRVPLGGVNESAPRGMRADNGDATGKTENCTSVATWRIGPDSLESAGQKRKQSKRQVGDADGLSKGVRDPSDLLLRTSSPLAHQHIYLLMSS